MSPFETSRNGVRTESEVFKPQTGSCFIMSNHVSSCLSNILQRSSNLFNCRVSHWMCKFKFQQQIELCKCILSGHRGSCDCCKPLDVTPCLARRHKIILPRIIPATAVAPCVSGIPPSLLVEVPEYHFCSLDCSHKIIWVPLWAKSFGSPQTILTNQLTKDKTKTHSKGIKGLSARISLIQSNL